MISLLTWWTLTIAIMIQLAVCAGLTVISTCSPRNFDYVKSLGAEYVFDASLGEGLMVKIKEIAPNLKYAIDCISQTTTGICAKALKPGGTVVR